MIQKDAFPGRQERAAAEDASQADVASVHLELAGYTMRSLGSPG